MCRRISMPSGYVNIWVAAIALWLRLRLPFCGRGFETQAHHLCFFNLYWNCNEKRTKINKKRLGLAHFYKKNIWSMHAFQIIHFASYCQIRFDDVGTSQETSFINIGQPRTTFRLFSAFSGTFYRKKSLELGKDWKQRRRVVWVLDHNYWTLHYLLLSSLNLLVK